MMSLPSKRFDVIGDVIGESNGVSPTYCAVTFLHFWDDKAGIVWKGEHREDGKKIKVTTSKILPENFKIKDISAEGSPPSPQTQEAIEKMEKGKEIKIEEVL